MYIPTFILLLCKRRGKVDHGTFIDSLTVGTVYIIRGILVFKQCFFISVKLQIEDEDIGHSTEFNRAQNDKDIYRAYPEPEPTGITGPLNLT